MKEQKRFVKYGKLYYLVCGGKEENKMGKSEYKKLQSTPEEHNRSNLNNALDKLNQEEVSNKKKKKNSSVKKSNHKHEYEEVLVYYLYLKRWCLGKRCKICGKAQVTTIFLTEKVDNGYRMLSSEEVFEKYKDILPTVIIERG